MIPLCKPQIKRTDLKAAKSVLKTGSLVQNFKVKELEKLVAKLTDSQHAIAMSTSNRLSYKSQRRFVNQP